MSVAEPVALAETPDLDGAFPRLSDERLAALAEHGRRRRTEEGEVLYRAGDTNCDFYAILDGSVALVEDTGDEQERLVGVHGRGRFLGGMGLLTGGVVFLTAVVRAAGEVVAVPTSQLRELVAADPGFGDLVLRAYLLRSRLLLDLGTGIRIIGSKFSPDTRRLREFAARNRLPHRWLDLERHPEAERLLRELHVSVADTPLVLWRGTVLRNPSNSGLARLIGLPTPVAAGSVYDLVVVGAGPAGLAAGVYGASEGLRTVVLDAIATGGQAERSPRIENYLGFPAGISGNELADRAVVQARRFDAHLAVPAEAAGLECRGGHHGVVLADGTTVSGRAVLIATGARYRRPDVPRLADFEGVCVYYAATELEVRLCRGDPVAVLGGGNSAGQAALQLAQGSPVVRLLFRGDDLGQHMSRYLVDRIERTPAIEVLRRTELRELVGDRVLHAVVAEDLWTGQRRTLDARALFVFIGTAPHTGWLAGQLALDDHGFVRTGPDPAESTLDTDRLPLETSRRGVFAAGDVRSGSIKRVASAVGEGSMAVRLVHDHLARTAGYAAR